MSTFTKTNKKFTSLKLSFNGEIRRLPIHSQGMTYQGLLEKTLSVFPRLDSIQFSWVDDESDTVVISSDAELAEALRIMASEKKGYLRFTVLSTSPPTSASGNQPATSHIRAYGTITHAGVSCSECGAAPVTGTRFKCSGRENYDLCEPCEGFVSREPYPTLKIYHPDQFSTGLSVFLDEKGGPKRGTHCHRGVTCNGCNTRNFKGPRFKCTERDDFNLCQDCEVLDDHKHMMVKMYPQHSHMTVHIAADVRINSLSVNTLPAATCHFRHSLYKRHGANTATARNANPRGAGWRKGKNKGKNTENGKGRHCWDRSSVAAAAAQRARAKQEENEFLEEQLVEMCINATKQEQSTPPSEAPKNPSKSPVRAHCWDRSSVAKAAAERARNMSLNDYQWVQRSTPVVDKSPPRQFPFLRKGCGRHNWDRFSSQELKNKAASARLRRQPVIQDMLQVQEDKKDAHREKKKGCGSIDWKQFSRELESKASSARRRRLAQEVLLVQEDKEDAHLEKSLLHMYHDSSVHEQKNSQKISSGQSSDEVVERKQGLKWVIAAGGTDEKGSTDVTDSAYKPAVKWVIVDDAPPQPPQRSSLAHSLSHPRSVAKVSSAATVAPPSAPPVAEVDQVNASSDVLKALKAKQEHILKVIANQEKHQLQEQREEQEEQDRQQREKRFNNEVSAWGHELEVLCDMGFSDIQQLIPLLKTHISTPASSQEPGAPLCEEGLQQVVMSLLTARN